MDPEEREKALEGEKDILTPLVQADEEIYESAPCPQCKSKGTKVFDSKLYLAGERPVPRYNMRCSSCGCVYSPFSGLVLEIGHY